MFRRFLHFLTTQKREISRFTRFEDIAGHKTDRSLLFSTLKSEIVEYLNMHQIDEASAVGHIIAKEMYISPDKIPPSNTPERCDAQKVSRLWEMLFLASSGRHPAYILKKWNFHHLELEMEEPIFIPRPETEELAELTLPLLEHCHSFLEVGCGSGAISLYLLDRCRWLRGVALDKMHRAVLLTQRNAEKLNLNRQLKIIHCEVSQLSEKFSGHKFDCIISNPPYVPSHAMQNRQYNCRFESDAAFDGGPDGCSVIRDILAAAPSVLSPSGLIVLEVDTTHPAILPALLSERFKLLGVHKDFRKNCRFCVIEFLGKQRRDD